MNRYKCVSAAGGAWGALGSTVWGLQVYLVHKKTSSPRTHFQAWRAKRPYGTGVPRS